MIKTDNAIRTARLMLGTPYSDVDCIGLIRQVIRRSPGGAADYTTAGTNTLWDSYNASAKYRDLTWRQEGLTASGPSGHLPQRGRLDAAAGMLAFKRDGEDVHHVGLVTHEGTVIHSSSALGRVVETELTASEGWELLAVHRCIETSSVGFAAAFPKGEGSGTEEREGAGMESYKAKVVLQDAGSTLNVRNEPGTGGDVIGRLQHGAGVTVQAAFDNGWLYVSYGDSGLGYVSGKYLQRVEDEPTATENVIAVSSDMTIVDDAGNTFKPVGGWRVLVGGVD